MIGGKIRLDESKLLGWQVVETALPAVGGQNGGRLVTSKVGETKPGSVRIGVTKIGADKYGLTKAT